LFLGFAPREVRRGLNELSQMTRKPSVRRAASGEGPKGPPFPYTRGVKRAKMGGATQAERRRTPRVQPSRSARLLDVSPQGLAIETPTQIETGTVYDLILGLDDQRMPVSARAVHVRRHGDLYRASFAFDRILDSDREQLQRSLVREVADRMTVILR
jgi:PilZ domain